MKTKEKEATVWKAQFKATIKSLSKLPQLTLAQTLDIGERKHFFLISHIKPSLKLARLVFLSMSKERKILNSINGLKFITTEGRGNAEKMALHKLSAFLILWISRGSQVRSTSEYQNVTSKVCLL